MKPWQEQWQAEAQTLAAGFYPEARAAFGFLETDYGYDFDKEELLWPEDLRDTEAQVTFAGERMAVMIWWYFSAGNIGVGFRRAQTPRQDSEALSAAEKRPLLPVTISLYSLARFLGTAQDPDFLMGDTWNVYPSKCAKRDALIKSDPRAVLDGLARATRRYAGHILRGDASQFAEVGAYYQAHMHDYWKRRKT